MCFVVYSKYRRWHMCSISQFPAKMLSASDQVLLHHQTPRSVSPLPLRARYLFFTSEFTIGVWCRHSFNTPSGMYVFIYLFTLLFCLSRGRETEKEGKAEERHPWHCSITHPVSPHSVGGSLRFVTSSLHMTTWTSYLVSHYLAAFNIIFFKYHYY